MNQILGNFEIENNNENDINTIKEKKRNPFKYIFFLSITTMILFSSFFIYKIYHTKENEKISNNLQYNYRTLKLYSSNDSSNYTNLTTNNSYSQSFIIGEIEIPSLNIFYPIFSMLEDDTLKVAPCIFHGKMPPETGNLCIAGHNYNNNSFFSSISKLKKEDKINIYDASHRKYTYSVFANYEVKTDDLSPISSFTSGRELTLVTCNNLNNNRIIIKARY